MKERVLALKNRHINATTQEEKDAVYLEMKKLQDEDADAWAWAMVENLKETNNEARAFIVKNQLEEILPIISAAYIAKNYFGKSKEWFYQKMNGNIVNGKPAQFSKEEIETLNLALQDISQKIGSIRVFH